MRVLGGVHVLRHAWSTTVSGRLIPRCRAGSRHAARGQGELLRGLAVRPRPSLLGAALPQPAQLPSASLPASHAAPAARGRRRRRRRRRSTTCWPAPAAWTRSLPTRAVPKRAARAETWACFGPPPLCSITFFGADGSGRASLRALLLRCPTFKACGIPAIPSPAPFHLLPACRVCRRRLPRSVCAVAPAGAAATRAVERSPIQLTAEPSLTVPRRPAPRRGSWCWRSGSSARRCPTSPCATARCWSRTRGRLEAMRDSDSPAVSISPADSDSPADSCTRPACVREVDRLESRRMGLLAGCVFAST